MNHQVCHIIWGDQSIVIARSLECHFSQNSLHISLQRTDFGRRACESGLSIQAKCVDKTLPILCDFLTGAGEIVRTNGWEFFWRSPLAFKGQGGLFQNLLAIGAKSDRSIDLSGLQSAIPADAGNAQQRTALTPVTIP